MPRPTRKEINFTKDSILSLMQEIYNELDGNCILNENTEQLFYDGMTNKENYKLIKSGMTYVKENHTYINRVNSLLSVL